MPRYSARTLRYNMPGFIGGKEVASKATDSELIRLARLQDKVASLHNRLLGSFYRMPRYAKQKAKIERQLKSAKQQVASLQKKIKARKTVKAKL